MNVSSPTSRRQFLQTVAFSAVASLAGRFDLRAAGPADLNAQHLFLFGDWGAIGDIDPQRRVSQAMMA
jgi:hypothetical protein